MSPTVHEVRNTIRVATGRFEREFDASFTKEELQAICAALEIDLGGDEAEVIVPEDVSVRERDRPSDRRPLKW